MLEQASPSRNIPVFLSEKFTPSYYVSIHGKIELNFFLSIWPCPTEGASPGNIPPPSFPAFITSEGNRPVEKNEEKNKNKIKKKPIKQPGNLGLPSCQTHMDKSTCKDYGCLAAFSHMSFEWMIVIHTFIIECPHPSTTQNFMSSKFSEWTVPTFCKPKMDHNREVGWNFPQYNIVWQCCILEDDLLRKFSHF